MRSERGAGATIRTGWVAIVAIVVVTLAVAGLGAVPHAAAFAPSPASAAAARPIPEKDPFFRPPHDLRRYRPGAVIRSRRVQVRAFELPVPARAWQILYRTSDRRGRPTVTATTLIVPTSAWRGRGRRPLVSYQVAEDSVSTRCAPSYALTAGLRGGYTNSYSEGPLIAAALLNGWAMAVPDYQGMRSEFLVAATSAKGVLDGVRAVKRFTRAGLTRSPVALWGYSGGSFATANAAQLQPSYAPGLRFEGIALGGLLGDVRAVINAFDGSIAGSAIPMGFHGFARSYPNLRIQQYLNARGRRYFKASADECLFESVLRHPFLRMSQISRHPDPLGVPAVARMLRRNSPLHRAGVPTAPVYEYHALLDEFAPIGPARAVLRRYCARGVVVQHRTKLIGEHLTEIIAGSAGAMRFLSDRFAGKSPTNDCGAIPR